MRPLTSCFSLPSPFFIATCMGRTIGANTVRKGWLKPPSRTAKVQPAAHSAHLEAAAVLGAGNQGLAGQPLQHKAAAHKRLSGWGRSAVSPLSVRCCTATSRVCCRGGRIALLRRLDAVRVRPLYHLHEGISKTCTV